MATLSWKTATEVNNYGSEIERRIISANSWIKVGYAQGKGTTNTSSEYSYRDAKLAAGKYEYGLKQIDLGGAFKYLQSTEIEIAIPKAFTLRQNYPNPFNPTTTIELTLAEDSLVSLKVFDMLGRKVRSLINQDLKAGVVHIDLLMLPDFLPVIILTVGNQPFFVGKKLVLMK